MPRSRQIQTIVAGLGRLTERVVIKIALDVTANLIEATPVDTGFASANWIPSVGRADRADPGVRDRSRVPGAHAKQALGQVAVAAYKLERGRVFVSNNVRYIQRLNDGSSQQAPRGFVQRAVRKAVTIDIRTLRT